MSTKKKETEGVEASPSPRGCWVNINEIVDPAAYVALAPLAGVKPSELKTAVIEGAKAVLLANTDKFSPLVTARRIAAERAEKLSNFVPGN